MDIRKLKQSELIELLNMNDWKVVEDKYWEKRERVIFKHPEKGSFVFQLKAVYYPNEVCRICEQRGIKPPEEIEKVAKQLEEMRKRK